MAGRPRNESNAQIQYWSPRGPISQQLLSQPRPDRHEYSYNQASYANPNPSSTLYPDLPLHKDVLELFQATTHATFIHPPYYFQPADPHGWYILNDCSLLPTIDSYGQVTDGEGRILGQIRGTNTTAPMPSPLYQFSSMDLGNLGQPSSAERFLTNPYSYPRQQPPNHATPASTSASFASRAETLVAQSDSEHSEANTNQNPVCDRKFDVGVAPT